MEHFEFMKECLQEFNYPQIYSMDDAQIIEIFSKTNREFLISWILKQIDNDYNEILEKSKTEDLANILHCNGFCSNSEKDAFITGACDVSIQFVIIYKMLKFLKSVSDGRKLEDNKTTSLQEIEEILNFDTNLFPLFGPKQIFSNTKRAKKIEEFKKEIEIIKNQKNGNPDLCLVDSKLNEKLTVVKSDLEMNYPVFKTKLLELLKNKENIEVGESRFSEDFAKTVQACKDCIAVILEFIKSVNVIQSFTDEDSFEIENLNNSRYTMIRTIYELSKEIDKLKTEN